MAVTRQISRLSLCLFIAVAGSAAAFAQNGQPCPGPNCPGPNGPGPTCQDPPWHSDAWWAMRAHDPIGSRQVECEGKLWPPYPRPTGPSQTCPHIYHAEHYWPLPYVCTDREVILTMMRTQEGNGWLTETTLFDYHFNPETNELTTPGKLHLKWILDYVPSSYRAVWLQTTDDQAVNQHRMNNVRMLAAKFVGEPNLPQIGFRTSLPPARPAIEVDTIRRKELESIPVPRVPFEAGAGGSASTSVGTGGGGGGGAPGGQ
jgi:hypothetical protein